MVDKYSPEVIIDFPTIDRHLRNANENIRAVIDEENKIILSYQYVDLFKDTPWSAYSFKTENTYKNIERYIQQKSVSELKRIHKDNYKSYPLDESKNKASCFYLLKYYLKEAKAKNLILQEAMLSRIALPKYTNDSKKFQDSGGRLFGIQVGNHFYVLFFDPEHEIWPEGVKKCGQVNSCKRNCMDTSDEVQQIVNELNRNL